MKPFSSLPWLWCCALIGGLPIASDAQRLYKYQDESGAWVFTDRPPDDGQQYEEDELKRTFQAPTITVREESVAGGSRLVAINSYPAPMQIVFRLEQPNNVSRDTPTAGDRVLDPRSETPLLTVTAADPSAPVSFRYEFAYLPGDPTARHNPTDSYRLPFARAKSFFVSQAYPDQQTHGDPASHYAIDFVMPVGSDVYAARGGVVMEVASQYFRSGTQLERDGPRANIVRILHDDGTFGLYAHLNWGAIRVVPGQRVETGEYIADSGNTGFSTGPHLHFAVQRNAGGRLVSVPVEFLGAGGAAVSVMTGTTATAY
jgi:murein DD-endopeptidase MepM/ murein hydrolase activator NlpD